MPKQIRWVGPANLDEVSFSDADELTQDYTIERGRNNTFAPVIISDDDVEFFLTYPGENVVVEEAGTEPEEDAEDADAEGGEAADEPAAPTTRTRARG